MLPDVPGTNHAIHGPPRCVGMSLEVSLGQVAGGDAAIHVDVGHCSICPFLEGSGASCCADRIPAGGRYAVSVPVLWWGPAGGERRAGSGDQWLGLVDRTRDSSLPARLNVSLVLLRVLFGGLLGRLINLGPASVRICLGQLRRRLFLDRRFALVLDGAVHEVIAHLLRVPRRPVNLVRVFFQTATQCST